ncbi:MAG: hypothetical protein JSS68_09320 [Actinobacteria bacterium]|nr:hypothetical protein [Actinomycetota bacterium]MBS1882933.1 hypothetical protein [Actinomycetota bacterium]
MTTFAAHLPDRPAVYSAKYHLADGGTEFVTVTRIDKAAGNARIIRDDDTEPRDDVVPLRELSSFVPSETTPILVGDDGTVLDLFGTHVYDVPRRWDGETVDYVLGADALESAGNVPHPEDGKLAELALTQCQHIAYGAVIEIENAGANATLGSVIEKGTEALNAVNSIAESGRPTVEFAEMLIKVRREDEEGEGSTLEPPEGCTGAVSVSPAGHPSIHRRGPTCPVHEDATAGDRTEELREQASKVVEEYRAAEDVGDAIEGLATILDHFHAVRNGWRPDPDDGWIGCEVECDDRVAFTVTAIGRGSEVSAMEGDDDRLVLKGGAEDSQGGCWEFADAVTIVHPPSEPQTEQPFIRIDFLRGDVDAMAESQGIDKALAWERAQDWAKAITENCIATINSELSDRIGEED